ncbi:MAG TPA: sugar porter family MFS transporter [Bryobacteraceae bacterium]|nr:sugar porter family MFS transporter [Bryobacteraceae bacterium]
MEALNTPDQKNSHERYHAGYVWLLAGVAALGGLLFGYDFVVIGGAKPFYESFFRLTSAAQIGWANSCALVGCLLGSVFSGAAADRFGRKRLLTASAALFAVSSVFTGWAPVFTAFVIWRIAGGIAIGIASNASPVYIAEISPAPWRGRLVSMNQMTIVIGILAAQIVNWLIAQPVPAGATAETIRQSWNGQAGWRWMFTAVAVPALIFLAGSLFVPESPRWLALRGRTGRARRTLARIGGEAYADAALADIFSTAEPQARQSWRAQLLAPGMRGILAVGVTLAVLQQWSGINVIFNYAEEVYRNAGYGVNDVLFNIVITGTVNLVFTFVALGFVDRVGRRPLMLAGCAGIGLCHLLIGLAYRFGLKGLPVLICTLGAIGCYAMSLAPVTWVLIAEIFPNRIRGAAVSVSVSALWIACFALTFTFPSLNAGLGPAKTFWVYAGICFAGLAFVFARVSETKGKTLEQIEREYARKR